MEKIIEIKSGSHLYGTQTENSDLDIKGVYLPAAEDILLQKIKPSISIHRQKDLSEKNTKDDLDIEYYSLNKFLYLLAEGQTVALEILFCPKDFQLMKPHPIWYEIQEIAKKILTKRSAAFVGYCTQQASKYGIKGTRLNSAKAALAIITEAIAKFGTNEKINILIKNFKALSKDHEYILIHEGSHVNDNLIEICGKKIPVNFNLKLANEIIEKLVSNYGERSLKAESNHGVDWKSLSHAVRVSYQAIEFLNTHTMTFPRPEKDLLLKIKLGKISFMEVSDLITNLLKEVELCEKKSNLPDFFDQQSCDNFIINLYKDVVINNFSKDIRKNTCK